jgi:protein-tyrosine-phosphatase
LVVTVCDEAHEELEPGENWLHWSIPDPVRGGRAAQFDEVIRDLRRRIGALNGSASEKES